MRRKVLICSLMVAAIARRGSRINEAPRKVVLQAGDTLL